MATDTSAARPLGKAASMNGSTAAVSHLPGMGNALNSARAVYLAEQRELR
jgi:hypothetical protein